MLLQKDRAFAHERFLHAARVLPSSPVSSSQMDLRLVSKHTVSYVLYMHFLDQGALWSTCLIWTPDHIILLQTPDSVRSSEIPRIILFLPLHLVSRRATPAQEFKPPFNSKTTELEIQTTTLAPHPGASVMLTAGHDLPQHAHTQRRSSTPTTLRRTLPLVSVMPTECPSARSWSPL